MYLEVLLQYVCDCKRASESFPFNYSNASREGLEYQDPDGYKNQLLRGRSRPRDANYHDN